MIHYWLMKSEPTSYSIDDLKRDGSTYWDGVRNYQARNMLKDQIRVKDLVFFYHSNAEPSGIAGIAEVVKAGYPDPSAFDKKSEYYDPKSSTSSPSWYSVEIQFVKKFPQVIPLDQLKKIQALKNMPLLRRGQRLSIQPVSKEEWNAILKLTA